MEPHARKRLRQLAEVRGWVGEFERPHRDLSLRAADGVQLAASFLPTADPAAPAVVVAHGFAAHRRKPAYTVLADGLAEGLHVLTIDHRGHGGSAGRSTFGAAERGDVAAGVSWLRAAGHTDIIALGVSMGGTAVIGALADDITVDGAVTISTGAFRGRLRRPGIADLDAVLRHPVKRQVWQWVAGFRFASPSQLRDLADPVALAGDVAVPVLLVHGADDDYFPPSDADALAAAIPAATTVWHEPVGFGHAETGLDREFVARLRSALRAFVDRGSFPARDELVGSG